MPSCNIAHISAPDKTELLFILKEKVKEPKVSDSLSFTEEALEYIANWEEDNIRVLNGALNKIIATCSLAGKSGEIDLKYAMECLE